MLLPPGVPKCPAPGIQFHGVLWRPKASWHFPEVLPAERAISISIGPTGCWAHFDQPYIKLHSEKLLQQPLPHLHG